VSWLVDVLTGLGEAALLVTGLGRGLAAVGTSVGSAADLLGVAVDVAVGIDGAACAVGELVAVVDGLTSVCSTPSSVRTTGWVTEPSSCVVMALVDVGSLLAAGLTVGPPGADAAGDGLDAAAPPGGAALAEEGAACDDGAGWVD
jgi:hypothetical protein